MRKLTRPFLISICICFAVGGSRAQTVAPPANSEKPFLHPLFSDDMVLQREVRFPIWGWTTPGSDVEVSMLGKSATAVADAEGKWLARLGPFKAGGPHVLTIRGPKSLTLNNVLVGDVWLASGQSNMEMGITEVNDAQQEVARAEYPKIRLFAVPKVLSTQPTTTIKGRWLVCNPSNIAIGGWGGFSAVAYFFGRHLHKELDIPIGLIHSSWGGTAAEGWVSAEALSSMPDFLPSITNVEKILAESKTEPASYGKLMEAWWIKNDPGSAAKPAWSDPSIDVGGWKTMRLPQFWEDAGLDGFDGVVWFRKTFELPARWKGRDLILQLGPVDDRDTTFINGVRVGAMNQWDAPRKYRIAAKTLKPGANTIAIRVLDTGVGGGIYGPAGLMKIEPASGSGSEPLALAGDWKYRVSVALNQVEAPPPQGGNDYSVVNIRYNGMIAPLLPFAIKGAIWYQGETNVGRGAQYERLMPVLIGDWRARFGVGDFPFLIAQLANYLERHELPTESEWARLREAQLQVAKSVPHAGLAVTADIGDAKDIHPKNKQDVGYRLALAALAVAYGRKLEFSGPQYRGMKIHGDTIRLAFDHAAGLNMKKLNGMTGFAIAGEDRRFVWANAEIKGKEVVVSSPDVKKPVAVRYAWADNPILTLYNQAGLPASPFRTDNFPAKRE